MLIIDFMGQIKKMQSLKRFDFSSTEANKLK